MKKIVITGRAEVSYRKVIEMPDDEAAEFMAEYAEDITAACQQINEEDLTEITEVDDALAICEEP